MDKVVECDWYKYRDLWKEGIVPPDRSKVEPMGPGYGGHTMGPGYPGYGPQYGPPQAPYYQQPREPLKEGDVKGMLENYLRSTRNPNLKLGKIKEQDTHFEAEIVTKDGSPVDKILVDKHAGWMRSMYY